MLLGLDRSCGLSGQNDGLGNCFSLQIRFLGIRSCANVVSVDEFEALGSENGPAKLITNMIGNTNPSSKGFRAVSLLIVDWFMPSEVKELGDIWSIAKLLLKGCSIVQ